MHEKSITINNDFDFAKLWFDKTCSNEYIKANISFISQYPFSTNIKETSINLLKNFKIEFLRLKPNQESLEKLLQFIVGKDESPLSSVLWRKNKPRNINLPTKILDFSFDENSNTTLILTMNNAWAVSFQISNTNNNTIKSKFKLIIKLLGRPSALLYIDAA